MTKFIILFLLTVFHLSAAAQKTPKPPLMGLSTWNSYRANINDSIIRAQADALVSKGLLDVGYNYQNIDDGFFAGRNMQGELLVNLKAGINRIKINNTSGFAPDIDKISIGAKDETLTGNHISGENH